MTKKNTLPTLDPTIAYTVIGLDLAKDDVAIAAYSSDNDQPYLVDRMAYADLYVLCDDLNPTLFVMEPCSSAHQIAQEIEALGHQTMMINGAQVQNWVQNHFNGQKTDLHDAIALANLATERYITSIRGKTKAECRLLALQAAYKQLQNHRVKTIVHIKSVLHAWGDPIPTGSFNKNKLRELVDSRLEKYGSEIVETLKLMIDRVDGLDKDIKNTLALLTNLTKEDPRAQRLMSIPGIGVLSASRWCAVMGEIKRFDGPKNAMAFVGLVPRNKITGDHSATASLREARGQGQMSKRGDKILRSVLFQGAEALCMLIKRGLLPDCPFVRRIQARLASPRSWFLVVAYVAAKLVRIAWALLTYAEKFSFEKAGISKAVLKQLAAEKKKATVAATAA